jgi:hypothetical protein
MVTANQASINLPFCDLTFFATSGLQSHLIEAVSEHQTLIRHFETERNAISDRFIAQLLIPINLNNLKQEEELHICIAYRADPQALVSFKRYMPPSSSLLQGKHLPFSPSPLRLNIFRLFVILSPS